MFTVKRACFEVRMNRINQSSRVRPKIYFQVTIKSSSLIQHTAYSSYFFLRELKSHVNLCDDFFTRILAVRTLHTCIKRLYHLQIPLVPNTNNNTSNQVNYFRQRKNNTSTMKVRNFLSLA